MKKIDYFPPEMKVYILQTKEGILTGSTEKSNVDDRSGETWWN